MSKTFKALGGLAATLAAMSLMGTPAMATDGYFAHGFGARHKALGGAGVADSTDSTASALNPAGLVHLKRDEYTSAVTAFSPRRKYSASGTTSVAPFGGSGTIDSNKNWFAIPNLAYAHLLHDNPYIDVIGFTVYGNGGMNTQYPASAGGVGVFGGGQAGVNLEQAIISLAFAKKIGNFSFGLAPAIVRQKFRATGIASFGANGLSVGPKGTIDRGDDVSWGYGLRYGVEWTPMSNVRIGVAGNTRFQVSNFERYAGLFAQQGGFDIPASIQAGIAVDVMPNLTFMLDYKHIWYGDIAAISNPSHNIVACAAAVFAGGSSPKCLGGENGAGFGWQDVDVIKVGAEWEALNWLTLRAGYSYTTQPIRGKDVTFNILAPGVVQSHFTGGAEVKLNDNWSVELEGMYAPQVSVTGPDVFNGLPVCAGAAGAVPCNGTETIRMYQYEITAGIKYKF